MNIVLATLNAKYIHSSLALRYLRAYAERDFPNISLCEYTIKDPPLAIVADLYRRRPDVAAFSIYIWNVEETIPVIRMLKQVLPQVRIVVGGPEVSYDIRDWMERLPEVDFLVYGEGEATFHHLLTELAGKGDFARVPGMAYRDGGFVRINPPREKVDLALIPSPYQDEADIRSLVNRIVYFETSRGCPFSCQFCLSSIEQGVRYFPLERVQEDLLRLIRAGVRTIKFVDRTFNLKRSYAMALFQFLIDHGGDTVFQFEITGDILHPEVVRFLTERVPKGKFRFEIGVQSTNDLTNTLVRRRQNFARLAENIRALKQAGNITLHLDLIAGLPEEDYASFRKTFDDVFALEPEELQLGFLKLLRGTGLREQAARYGYVFMDRAPYEVLCNRVLSFQDLLAIKQVEDVLDKYWNDGKWRTTVRFLVRHVFRSGFDFFQAFGAYWEAQGWQRIGHQVEDLGRRLLAFVRDHCGPQAAELAEALLIYDFLRAYRTRPHNIWWEKRLDKHGRAEVARLALRDPERLFGPAFAALGLTEQDLEKHVLFELLPYRFDPSRPDEPPVQEPCLLAVYYRPGLAKGETPPAFLAPLSSWDLPGWHRHKMANATNATAKQTQLA
ncbi:B12-binding domain-containing radical SAM protein [Alicyclobacillus cellulosilyticus]|uniref:B12-binding domain-containing radical SAM protein n=1 Tax=Alicyclobacillus cellulosilyticus TaxID=1003997 RepID=A0A917K8H5_9BACL|nr:B12-binding domain-containing radical SAM protein [Alicyclobacillus cellulosilyticus]GGJ02693.1 B12-binding domain-containing radical SAM protein [Alicyclobacillus cellulosilyticus]